MEKIINNINFNYYKISKKITTKINTFNGINEYNDLYYENIDIDEIKNQCCLFIGINDIGEMIQMKNYLGKKIFIFFDESDVNLLINDNLIFKIFNDTVFENIFLIDNKYQDKLIKLNINVKNIDSIENLTKNNFISNKKKILILNKKKNELFNLILKIFKEYDFLYETIINENINDENINNYFDKIINFDTIKNNTSDINNNHKYINIAINNNNININDFSINKNNINKIEYSLLISIEADENNYNKLINININNKITNESNLFIKYDDIIFQDKNINNRIEYIKYLYFDYNCKLYYSNKIDYSDIELLILIDIPNWAFDYLINSYKQYLQKYVVIRHCFINNINFKPKKIISYQYWTHHSFIINKNIDAYIISDFMPFIEEYSSVIKYSLEEIINKNISIYVSNSYIREYINKIYNYDSSILTEKSFFKSTKKLNNINYLIKQGDKIKFGTIGNFNSTHKNIKQIDNLIKIIENYKNTLELKIIDSSVKKLSQIEIIKFIENDIDMIINFSKFEGAPRMIIDGVYMGKGFISRCFSCAIDILNDAKIYNLIPGIIYETDEEFINILNNLTFDKIQQINNHALIYSKIINLSNIRYSFQLKNLNLKYKNISILMPFYNTNFNYFIKSIESIKFQTGLYDLLSIECVIIDDHSTIDNYNKMIEMLNDCNLNIKLIRLNNNYGVSTALHIGLLECTYDFIIRMDSDDIMIKDRLLYQSYMYEKYEKQYENLVILGGDIIKIDNNNNFMQYNYPSRPFYIDKNNYISFDKWYLNHPTICFNKNKFLKYCNYPPFLKNNAEDLLTWTKIIINGGILINDEKPIVLYRQHQMQISNNNDFRSNVNSLVNNLDDNLQNYFYNIEYQKYIESILYI